MNIIKSYFLFSWFALLLFIIGFCASFFVDHFDIKFIKAFPQWFMNAVIRYVNPQASFIRIFLFIFLFNSVSIMVYVSSGVFIILPFLITFLTGMNIGVTIFLPHPKGIDANPAADELHGGALKIALFSMLVLLIEVLTFSLAMGMGMSLAVNAASNYKYTYVMTQLIIRLKEYMIICVPALFISAYLEATVIKGSGIKV